MVSLCAECAGPLRRALMPGGGRPADTPHVCGRLTPCHAEESHGSLAQRTVMINWLIEVSLRNRFPVIVAFLLMGGWGYWALRTTRSMPSGLVR